MPPAAMASSDVATQRSASLAAGAHVGAQQQVEAHRARELRRRRRSRPTGRRGGRPSWSTARVDGREVGPGPAASRERVARAGPRRAARPASARSARRLRQASSTAWQQLHEARTPGHRLGGEVGAAEERLAVGGHEDRHRPAARAGHRLGGLHVDGVDVGSLLAVDLHVDEQLVHHRRGRRVLEGLVGHHVAPVAGRVADRQQDGHVPAAGLGERLVAPRVPVDRVVGVLAQVRAGLAAEPVHTCTVPTPGAPPIRSRRGDEPGRAAPAVRRGRRRRRHRRPRGGVLPGSRRPRGRGRRSRRRSWLCTPPVAPRRCSSSTTAGVANQQLTTASRSFLEAPPQGLCDHPVLTPRAFLTFARPARSSCSHDEVAAVGVLAEVELLDAAATRALAPYLRADAVVGGMLEPGAQDIDVMGLHQGFVRGARAAGAVLARSAGVRSIDPAPQARWRGRDGRRCDRGRRGGRRRRRLG